MKKFKGYKIMKDSALWLSIALFGIIGVAGSSVRYLHEVNKGAKFSLKRWFSNTLIGATIAVITGMLCQSFNLGDEVTYAIVAISAISAKELIESGPDIIIRILDRKSK